MSYRTLLILPFVIGQTVAADTQSAATCLSENTPTLEPQYFLTHYGRPGIWVSTLKPRYSGVSALVTLRTKDKNYVLMTLQDRLFDGKSVRVAEGPGGGFDTTHKEGIERFSAREQILYKDYLAGIATDHRKLEGRVQERLDREGSHVHPLWGGGDRNTYRAGVRETFEETGVEVVTLSDAQLHAQAITRAIRLMRLDEDERSIMPMYHIAFECTDCTPDAAPFVARAEPNEEIVTAFWADFDAISKSANTYELLHDGKLYAVKARNAWNEALDELFGVVPAALPNLQHEALINQR